MKHDLLHQWYVSQYRLSQQLLTDAGVPLEVTVDGVGDGALPHRLQWFLLRRKDVQPSETDGAATELELHELVQIKEIIATMSFIYGGKL